MKVCIIRMETIVLFSLKVSNLQTQNNFRYYFFQKVLRKLKQTTYIIKLTKAECLRCLSQQQKIVYDQFSVTHCATNQELYIYIYSKKNGDKQEKIIHKPEMIKADISKIKKKKKGKYQKLK